MYILFYYIFLDLINFFYSRGVFEMQYDYCICLQFHEYSLYRIRMKFDWMELYTKWQSILHKVIGYLKDLKYAEKYNKVK